MPDDVNPFAPPLAELALKHVPSVDEAMGKVWRWGDRMVIGNNAELEPICFVTGQPAVHGISMVHYWQPKWVYLSLLPGLLPYIVVSPMFCRTIRLKVPVSGVAYQRHNNVVNRGMIVFAVALILAFLSIFLQSSPFFAAACLVGVPSIFMTSRPLVKLSVVKVTDHVLILRNVNAACLAPLPEWPFRSETIGDL